MDESELAELAHERGLRLQRLIAGYPTPRYVLHRRSDGVRVSPRGLSLLDVELMFAEPGDDDAA